MKQRDLIKELEELGFFMRDMEETMTYTEEAII